MSNHWLSVNILLLPLVIGVSLIYCSAARIAIWLQELNWVALVIGNNTSLNNKRRTMNRSSKGFGLTGVAIAVVLMFITAVFSTSAKSADAPTTLSVQSSVK